MYICLERRRDERKDGDGKKKYSNSKPFPSSIWQLIPCREGKNCKKKINGDQHYDTASNLGEKDKKLLFV